MTWNFPLPQWFYICVAPPSCPWCRNKFFRGSIVSSGELFNPLTLIRDWWCLLSAFYTHVGCNLWGTTTHRCRLDIARIRFELGFFLSIILAIDCWFCTCVASAHVHRARTPHRPGPGLPGSRGLIYAWSAGLVTLLNQQRASSSYPGRGGW